MVPASIARGVSLPVTRIPDGLRDPRPWRPVNVPLAASADVRALMRWCGLLGVLGVLLLLGHVWVRLKVIEAGYRLSVTRQLVERLEQEGRELDVRAAAADAGGRLEEMAARRLGMRPPERAEEEPLS
jgi:cell division protein FtsL